MSTNGGIFMSINLISLKCPECGATLHVEEDRKECFCSYCGNRVIVQNENEKTININKHIVDETEIKKIENQTTRLIVIFVGGLTAGIVVIGLMISMLYFLT